MPGDNHPLHESTAIPACATAAAPGFWSSRAWLFGALLVAGTFIAYLPALQGKFVWDDDSWTTNISGLLRDRSGLWRMWSVPGALQQYFPLTGTTFWIDYQLWGFWTLPYHVENVLLHAIAALLFWRLLWRLQVPGAWLAGAIFALHPVMVESAGWITERKNVLSLVLYLGALLAYGRFAGFWKADNRPAAPVANAPSHLWGAYGLALLLFVAADLAKATAFSLPAVLLLVCWWKRGRIRWQADVFPSLPFFAIAVGLGLVTAWLERNSVGASGPEWAISLPERCLIAGRVLWFYTGKLLWPANLCFLYPRWHLDAGSFGQWLCSVAAGGTLLGLWLSRGRIGRGPATAAFFFAGTLFPVLGFMNPYFMRYSFVCDHWVYLSSLGLVALGAALLARVAARLGPPVLLYGIAAILLPVLGVLTWQQSKLYTDMETLWVTTLARNPVASMAHNNLGNLLLQRGQVDEAIDHFQQALDNQPNAADVHCNLGGALLQRGRVEEALAQLQQALQIQPDSTQAHINLGNVLLRKGRVSEAIAQFQRVVELQPGLASAHYNLGGALVQAGRVDEAVTQLRRALELQPDLAEARMNLGNVLLGNGQGNEAIAQFQKAVELQPRLAAAHHNLANALFQEGQMDAALAHFQKALAIQPDFAAAHNGLGNALLRRGQVDEAIAHFRRATSIQPGFAEAQLNLANALLQTRQVDEAIAHFQKALELQPDQAGAHNNLANALLSKGQVDDAIAHFRLALQLQPNLAEAHNNLANALVQKGRAEEAVAHYEAAIANLPGNPRLLNNLAWVLATCPQASVRNGLRAVELAQQAVRLSGTNDPSMLGTLSAAYAETGRFSEAMALAEKACAGASAAGDRALLEKDQQLLELYRRGQPYHEPAAGAQAEPNPKGP